MISLREVSKSFEKTKAVSRISFDVNEGETLILLGKSGCGKTTTLKMINRLIKPDEGSIYINGKDNSAINPEQLRLGIGYVLQNHGLFPHYNIAQNMAIVPNLLKWDEKRIAKRTDELLQKLHLSTDIKTKFPDQLSGGQQQRVGLARALAASPPILLMDEPFGALDPITREKIKAEFLNLDELQSKTIVMVTHDVQEAFELGDKICLMDEGEILQIGKPEELLWNPANEKVINFIKSQHLQLSLKTILLSDLWKEINSLATKNASSHIEAKQHHIWSALQLLSNQQLINISLDGEIKTIDSASLITAFEAHKIKGYGRE